MYGPDAVVLVETAAIGTAQSVPCVDPAVRLARVELDAVASRVIVTEGHDQIGRRGSALVAAMLTGIAEATRDMSSEYAKIRVQFGRPIGVNQAIKHACADMALRAEAASAQLLFAALSVDEGRSDAAFQVAAARIVATDAAVENATRTIQVHGGMGYTFEHDAHLFLKRARVLDRVLGDSRSQMAALIELFPIFSRLRMLRAWGGIVDVCPDASPIVSKTPVKNLFINCGWGTGGFKATPGSGWVFAHTIATGEPHPLNAAFSLDRFTSGALIDEHGAAAVAH